MVEIELGQSVRSVRFQLGIGDPDYYNAWRQLCAKAREIYTTGAINEFKEYYRLNGDVVGSPLLHRKIMDALEIRGAAAWFVHYAVKRNYDKWNRDTKNSTVEERVNAYTANKVGTSTKADTRTRRVMWDPVRDL